MSNETDPKISAKASEDSPPAPTQDKTEAVEGSTAPSEREKQDKSKGVTIAPSELSNKDKATEGGTAPTIKENNDIAKKVSAVPSEQENKDKATGGTALSKQDSNVKDTEGNILLTEQDNKDKDKANERRTSLAEQDNKEKLKESPLVPKQENQEEAVTKDGAKSDDSCDCAQALIAKLVTTCGKVNKCGGQGSSMPKSGEHMQTDPGEPRFSLRLKLPVEHKVQNPTTPTAEPTEKLKSGEDMKTEPGEPQSSLKLKLPAEPTVENPPTPTEEPTENQRKTEEKENIKSNSD